MASSASFLSPGDVHELVTNGLLSTSVNGKRVFSSSRILTLRPAPQVPQMSPHRTGSEMKDDSYLEFFNLLS